MFPTLTRLFFPWYGKQRNTDSLNRMLMAKRRRLRRGKTGGPPRNLKTFRTFIGRVTKNPHFLFEKQGFDKKFLLDDLNLTKSV